MSSPPPQARPRTAPATQEFALLGIKVREAPRKPFVPFVYRNEDLKDLLEQQEDYDNFQPTNFIVEWNEEALAAAVDQQLRLQRAPTPPPAHQPAPPAAPPPASRRNKSARRHRPRTAEEFPRKLRVHSARVTARPQTARSGRGGAGGAGAGSLVLYGSSVTGMGTGTGTGLGGVGGEGPGPAAYAPVQAMVRFPLPKELQAPGNLPLKESPDFEAANTPAPWTYASSDMDRALRPHSPSYSFSAPQTVSTVVPRTKAGVSRPKRQRVRYEKAKEEHNGAASRWGASEVKRFTNGLYCADKSSDPASTPGPGYYRVSHAHEQPHEFAVDLGRTSGRNASVNAAFSGAPGVAGVTADDLPKTELFIHGVPGTIEHKVLHSHPSAHRFSMTPRFAAAGGEPKVSIYTRKEDMLRLVAMDKTIRRMIKEKRSAAAREQRVRPHFRAGDMCGPESFVQLEDVPDHPPAPGAVSEDGVVRDAVARRPRSSPVSRGTMSVTARGIRPRSAAMLLNSQRLERKEKQNQKKGKTIKSHREQSAWRDKQKESAALRESLQAKWAMWVSVLSRVKVIVDTVHRQRFHRLKWLREHRSARIIQKYVRRWLQRMAELRQHTAAMLITRCARRFIKRRETQKRQMAAAVIINTLRAISSNVKAYAPLHAFAYRVIMVQRWWRWAMRGCEARVALMERQWEVVEGKLARLFAAVEGHKLWVKRSTKSIGSDVHWAVRRGTTMQSVVLPLVPVKIRRRLIQRNLQVRMRQHLAATMNAPLRLSSAATAARRRRMSLTDVVVAGSGSSEGNTPIAVPAPPPVPAPAPAQAQAGSPGRHFRVLLHIKPLLNLFLEAYDEMGVDLEMRVAIRKTIAGVMKKL